MVNGNVFPKTHIKTIALIIAVMLVAVVSAGLLSSCSSAPEKPQVTKKEAEQAKKKGLELYKQGKWTQAQTEFEKAVQGNPKDVNAQFQLAYTYNQKGDLDNAYKRYQEIAKLNKEGVADAHYGMGAILMKQKKVDEAIAEFEKAAKLDTDFTSVRVDLAAAYTQKKEYDKALASYAELEKILKADPFFLSNIHVEKAKIYQAQENKAKAVSEYQAAVKLNKNNKIAADALKTLQ